MPYVNVQITKGATREQKVQMVKDITNSLVNVLGKKPEHIHNSDSRDRRNHDIFVVYRV